MATAIAGSSMVAIASMRWSLWELIQYVHHLDDPYTYVISANIHRRHLTAEQKRELIAKLLKAKPEASDRQTATAIKVDHKTVGAVRADLEGRGEIPHVSTRTDTSGRKQTARRGQQHYCWECNERGGEVQKHHYDGEGDDGEVWLHDGCVAAFEAELRRLSSPAYLAGRMLHDLDEMVGEIESHPDWFGVFQFSEHLALRGRALVELAGRPPPDRDVSVDTERPATPEGAKPTACATPAAAAPPVDDPWEIPAILDRRVKP
jgi:hypothetical protein